MVVVGDYCSNSVSRSTIFVGLRDIPRVLTFSCSDCETSLTTEARLFRLEWACCWVRSLIFCRVCAETFLFPHVVEYDSEYAADPEMPREPAVVELIPPYIAPISPPFLSSDPERPREIVAASELVLENPP